MSSARPVSGAFSLPHLALVVLIAAAGLLLRYGVFVWDSGATSFDAYVQALCVWDCTWYRSIADGGYDLAPGIRYRAGGANWAFFPLSPLLAGLLSKLTGLAAPVCGFILSNTYVVIAALISRPLFRGRDAAYWLLVVALLMGPFSFLFSSLHTEAMFILATTLTFLALERSRYLLSGAFGALLSATRVTGVLIVFAILAQAVTRHFAEGRRWRDLPGKLLGNPDLVLALVLAPIGLFAFMAFLHVHAGDGLGFAHIQRAWGRALNAPWVPLTNLFRLNWPLDAWSMVTGTWTIIGLIGLVLSIVLAVQRRLPAAIFCALCIIVSFAGGSTSLVRFVAGLAPLGWALCDLLSRWKPAYLLAFPVAIGSGLVLTLGWMNRSLVVM